MKKEKIVKVSAIAMSSVFILTSVFASVPITGYADEEKKAAQTTDSTEVFPYQDTSLSFEERAADLVSRMTLEEKQSQLRARTAPEIPRLGVRKYDWWSEALHGVARSGEATSFPTGLGIASSWNRELVKEMMDITSDEARAYANEKGKGLSYWSPTINMARDPRWGRAEETYGEDPYLSAQIGNSFVEGLQGNDDKYLKSIATIKHFALNNSEFNRHDGDSQTDERTLREYYTKAFKDVVEQSGVESIMTSYNRVNGVPMSANKYMLDTLARRTWGFDGYVVSDCGAIGNVFNTHKWVPDGWDHPVDATEATMFCLQAGTDLECGGVYAAQAINAVNAGLLSEGDIDVALVRLFTARMKTGEFDPQEQVPYASEEYSWNNQISAPDHTEKAEEASEEAVVMLKNEPAEGQKEKILPLDKSKLKSVVIVGELADQVILGDYSGSPKDENKSTPVQGLQKLLGAEKVTYIKGGASVNGTYNYNIKNFKLLDDSGETIKEMQPSENAGMSDCKVEASGNLGFTRPGGYIFYKEVDMTDVKKISAEVAVPGNALGGTIEIRLGGPDGTLVGTIQTEHTQGGWQDYETFTGDYSQGGFTGKQDVYFVFKEPFVEVKLTEEEQEAVKKADAVIAYVGTKESDSAEEVDRKTMELPRHQADLVELLAGLNKNTVAYIQSVSEVNLESFKKEVPAILWCTYNGQAQGNAMAKLLLGDANPSGKLPFTWYTSEKDLPAIGDYSIRSTDESNGRTYQYYQGESSYPFGHGLSYSSFEYSNLKLSTKNVTPNDVLTVSVDVKNTSNIPGAEVVEVYTKAPEADGKNRPKQELKGFEKVELQAGETKTVNIKLPMSEQYYWDEVKMSETYDQGTWEILVGSSSEDIRLTDKVTLKGQIDQQLEIVTAIPDKTSLDADKADNKAITKLSATMNDQSFVDLEKATVKYSSSNEEVATVDKDGVVTPVAGGTALITASVTVDGITKEDSYAVAVAQELYLKDILVDGKSLTGFTPEQEKYQYIASGNSVPEIEALVPQGMTVEVTQAESVPGTAKITVQSGAIKRTYTIEFLNKITVPESIDFATVKNIDELKNAGWEIIRPDEEKLSLNSEKGLVVTSQKGDLYKNTNTGKNVVVKSVSGDWSVTAPVHIESELTQGYQQAGLMIYSDDDNYIKICVICQNGKQQIQFGIENDASWSEKFLTPIEGTDFVFKIVKNKNTYQALYSQDGENFSEAGNIQVEYEAPKVALYAINGDRDVKEINAEFKNVKFEALPTQCTCDLYDLAFVGGDDFAYEEAVTGQGVKLKASAMKRGGCQVEGHLENEIQYAYSIPEESENTAEAIIEGDVLKAKKAGKVTVEVKSTWNGIEKTAQKELNICEENLASYKTKLQNEILRGETEIVPKKDKYTETSFEAYMKKLNEAKAVLGNEKANREMLVKAQEELLKAEEALAIKDNGGNTGGTGGNTGANGDGIGGNTGNSVGGNGGNSIDNNTGSSTGTGKDSNKSKVVKTGDKLPIMPMIGMMLAGVTIIAIKKRRDIEQDEK